MCGIFGLMARPGFDIDRPSVESLLRKLFLLSASRGKESAGLAIRNAAAGVTAVFKRDLPADRFLEDPGFRAYLSKNLGAFWGASGKRTEEPIVFIGHSRLVTNGTASLHRNNQPVINDKGVVVHNGILVNIEKLWSESGSAGARQAEVDSEFIAWFLRHAERDGMPTVESLHSLFQKVYGAASIAYMSPDLPFLTLATNNGSLYVATTEDGAVTCFASEDFIMRTLREWAGNHGLNLTEPRWVEGGNAVLAHYTERKTEHLAYTAPTPAWATPAPRRMEVFDESAGQDLQDPPAVSRNLAALEKLLEFPERDIRALRRCTRCILPETFPFIQYDSKGVCNYCNNFQPGRMRHSEAEFGAILDKHRKKNGKQDCIVAFSGGRDSSYGLHLLKTKYDMNPLTFTYDWGMVTDLARRNISRITAKLGLENILISADIAQKRRNIRLNVSAWLKKPDLGMIPLLMSGDKHFFMWVNELKRRSGIPLDIWLANSFENTDFKSGFCGIPPYFEKERIDRIRMIDKLRMPLYYLKHFLTNPSYLNASLPDTFTGYYAYYFEPRTGYYLMFDYIPWEEKVVEDVLRKEYDWELAPDTTSTWRIGDGTAAFYNYAYYTMTGFSEFDTFRSNQIRSGATTRDTVMASIYDENRPRFESLLWYLDVIGVDYESAIAAINSAPRLYRRSTPDATRAAGQLARS